MKKWAKYFIAGGLLALSGAANAQFSSTISGTSDYDFRGVSLSATNPALQVSGDYAFGETGFSVGAWGTNLDYGPDYDGNIEIDLYGEWAKEFEGGVGVSIGAVWYTYPDSSASDTKLKIEPYVEPYVGMKVGSFDAKYWYSPSYSKTGDSASYFEMNYSAGLPLDLSMGFHAGYSFGAYWGDAKYYDYAVSLGRDFGNFNFELKWVTTDTAAGYKVHDDVFNNGARLLFTVSTTVPWGK